MDRDTELGFGEFLLFVMVIKNIETHCIGDGSYAKNAFPEDEVTRTRATKFFPMPEEKRRNSGLSWKEAKVVLEKNALNEAWDRLIHYFDSVGLSGEDPQTRLRRMFQNIDSDKDGKLDNEEVAIGFVKLGFLANSRQVRAFVKEIDTNEDGVTTLEEFETTLEKKRKQLADEHSTEPSYRKTASSFADVVSQAQEHTKLQALDPKTIANFARLEEEVLCAQDMDRPLSEVVALCSRRISARFLHEYETPNRLQRQAGEETEQSSIDLVNGHASISLARTISDRVTSEFYWFSGAPRTRVDSTRTVSTSFDSFDGPPQYNGTSSGLPRQKIVGNGAASLMSVNHNGPTKQVNAKFGNRPYGQPIGSHF